MCGYEICAGVFLLQSGVCATLRAKPKETKRKKAQKKLRSASYSNLMKTQSSVCAHIYIDSKLMLMYVDRYNFGVERIENFHLDLCFSHLQILFSDHFILFKGKDSRLEAPKKRLQKEGSSQSTP